MLNVLQLSKFYPPVEGGIESVVFEITEELVRLGQRVSVLCANTRNETEVQDSRYLVVRAASWGKLFSMSLSPALISRLRTMVAPADVVHVHMPDPMAALALRLTLPKSHKLVVHWHSDVVNQKLTLRLYEPLQTWLLNRADSIVTTSQRYGQDSHALQQYAGKITAIPIGIRPLAQPKEDAIQAVNNRYGNKRIIFSLGRHVYYKGFSVLIDAAQHLPDDAVVVIGGRGPLSGVLAAKIKQMGLESKVYLPGRLSDEEVAAHYHAACLFCLPSVFKSEAFGVVLLEAMAAGKPIVATDIRGSGVPWVNQHGSTGINVPPADPPALARAICELLNDKARADDMGAAGKKRFSNDFTVEMMGQRFLDVYRSLTISPT